MPLELNSAAATPPVADKRPKTNTIHGDTRVDHYFWLREKGAGDVTAYLEAENVYTDAVLKPTEAFQSALYDEMLARIQETDLSVPYRQGGWTVKQLVHHIADSHMNAFIRIRLALTEDWPLVPDYNQDAWAALADSNAPVEWSLELIESLHARWGMLLRSLSDAHFQRGFKHAERGPMTIEFTALLYAWHGRHHLAHITRLRVAQAW